MFWRLDKLLFSTMGRGDGRALVSGSCLGGNGIDANWEQKIEEDEKVAQRVK